MIPPNARHALGRPEAFLNRVTFERGLQLQESLEVTLNVCRNPGQRGGLLSLLHTYSNYGPSPERSVAC